MALCIYNDYLVVGELLFYTICVDFLVNMWYYRRMIPYAGIGSRRITPKEDVIIKKIAEKLSSKFILYSGNAEGSDIAFQSGSNGNCVIMLPWKSFNENMYTGGYIEKCIVGDTVEGRASIDKYHPRPSVLSRGAKALMGRNYHQIHGYGDHKMVKLVVCCADPDGNGVKGGTGQAVRMAQDLGIPVVNIRVENWSEKLKEICMKLIDQNK